MGSGGGHSRWLPLRSPGLAVLCGYRRSWLRGDLIAGVTVAAYLVPQVMAYAGVAGLPPVTGLWAALPPLACYAMLGSSRLVSLGPDATTALMTAVAIGPLAAGDPARYAALAATLALLTGALAVLAWLARLGFVAALLSRPVIVGYLTGVAFIMIAGQLGQLTGVRVTGETFIAQVVSFACGLAQVRPGDVIIAAAVLAFLFIAQSRWPRLPGPLTAVLLSTAACAIFGLGRHGVALVGHIPPGLPAPRLPVMSLRDVQELMLPALGVLLVAFSDDVLTARAFERGGEVIDANQELLALGVSNAGAGLLRGFPVSSSGSRTAIAMSAGAHTQAYSLAALVSILGVLLFARPVLASFPLATLGALVIYAAVRLIDVRAFRRLAAFRISELVLALSASVGVLVFNILYGVLAAVGLSVAELLLRVGHPHDAIQGLVPGLPGMHDVDDYPQAELIPGLVVYRYDAPLFFANAQDFRRRALAAADQGSGPTRWFVLNTEAIVEVDFTALEAVEAVRAELTSRGIVFALARVKQDLLDDLQAFGLAQKIGEQRIFPTLPTAVAAYRQWVKEHPQQGPDQARSESCFQVPDTAPGPCETDQQSPGEKEAGDDR
jgi:sulfate permease, SulP family